MQVAFTQRSLVASETRQASSPKREAQPRSRVPLRTGGAVADADRKVAAVQAPAKRALQLRLAMVSAVRALSEAFQAFWLRARARSEIASLDASSLRDLGVSRGDLMSMASSKGPRDTTYLRSAGCKW